MAKKQTPPKENINITVHSPKEKTPSKLLVPLPKPRDETPELIPVEISDSEQKTTSVEEIKPVKTPIKANDILDNSNPL